MINLSGNGKGNSSGNGDRNGNGNGNSNGTGNGDDNGSNLADEAWAGQEGGRRGGGVTGEGFRSKRGKEGVEVRGEGGWG